MWVEKEPKTGKIRYCERFKNYLTGKMVKVSVTYDKDTAKNRKDAQNVLAEKISVRMAPVEKQFSLTQLIDEYRVDQKKIVKASTYKRNYSALEAVKQILSPDIIVEHMTARYVRTRLLETGKANSTLNEYLKRFKAMIRWAYRSELITSPDLADKIKPFPDVSPQQRIEEKYMEADELQLVIKAMDHPLWPLITSFLALSGLRIGELTALNKKDIDLKAGVIHVNKTYDPNNKIITSAKTIASMEDVYIQPQLEKVIHQINVQMLRQKMRYRYKSSLFVCSTDGSFMGYAAYEKYLKETTLRIIGRELTPHSLRHTHASLLFEKGFSLEEVARRLRHGNSMVTKQIYIHVTKKLREKDAEKLRSTTLF